MAIQLAHTESGVVRGACGGNPAVSVFRGIPYAAPPVGALRWQPPQPAAPWQGIRDATTFQPIAAQTEEAHPFFSKEFYQFRPKMSEDCLYLNIWTPAETADEKRPVMFFIHGGGFQSGYSYEITMDGEGMARKGVILVTIAYRLGCLGYLVHDALTAQSPWGVSGNYGLLDQIAALHWVKRNIAAFGGDPNNITVFGQSAGAMSVQHLMNAPLSRNDMNKVILESAGGYGSPPLDAIPMLPMDEAARVGAAFWKHLGVSTVAEARAVPAEELVAQARAFCEAEQPGFSFAPVVDGYVQPTHVSKTVQHNLVPDIPCLLGCCTNENGPNTCLPRMTEKAYETQVRQAFGADAANFLQLIDLARSPANAIDGGGWNDSLLTASIAWCEHFAGSDRKSPSYLYAFDRHLPGDQTGAFHSSELWYVFQTLNRCWRPMTGEDFMLADRISRYWTNFAKTGDPNGDCLPEWTPYRVGNRRAMRLGLQTGMTEQFASRRAWFVVDKILRDMDNGSIPEILSP